MPPYGSAESAEWSGEEYGKGCPHPSRLGGLESVVGSPNGVRGGAPDGNAFWFITRT